jgi:hypothetical protein
MRLPVGIPLVIRNVKIAGPKGSISADLIFDKGAAFTALPWYVPFLNYNEKAYKRNT